MTIENLYKIFLEHPQVQTDTRKIKPGDIFFALKGDNFNGNHFVQKALELGASYCVADEQISVVNDKIIIVDDVLSTLQQLGKYHRQQLNIPVIAITGSNGKTTTKELVHAVLSSQYNCYTTEGNLNNHIGIPLTLLKIKPDAEIAVVEMGANHQGEIADYCTYTLPTHGLITNVGKAHLEGFGGAEGVLNAKCELFDYLRKNDGTAFIFDDYEYLHQKSEGIKTVVQYGTNEGLVTGYPEKNDFYLNVRITGGLGVGNIQTQLTGVYNLPNVLAAACIGKYFNVPEEKIKTALENYVPSNSRSQVIKQGSNTIILDAYNANPSSMRVAIDNLRQMTGDKKVLILGSMKEMGKESAQEHRDLVEYISNFNWESVALTGSEFENIPENFVHFQNSEAAREWFLNQNFEEACILIKGSRSTQMEKILEE